MIGEDDLIPAEASEPPSEDGEVILSSFPIAVLEETPSAERLRMLDKEIIYKVFGMSAAIVMKKMLAAPEDKPMLTFPWERD